MLAPRRLPGIQIDATPPQAVEALPRMDVAVLVGFATTGPLHLPVPIESVGQYMAVFGADAPLAWDPVRGERVFAHLGPAVRAFFANGGRRCWVIRVARCAASEALRRGIDVEAATKLPDVAWSNRFVLPGVLSVAAKTAATGPALAQARCEGSWSDGLKLSTALAQQSFALDALIANAPNDSRRLFLRTRFGLQVGDLLQFGSPNGTCAYAAVDAVAAVPGASGQLEIECTVCAAAFERLSDSDASPMWATGMLDIVGLPHAAPATLAALSQAAPQSEPRPEPRLCILPGQPLPASLENGHWARWRGGGETVWLRIDAIERRPASSGSPATIDPSLVDATLEGPAWRELGAMYPAALAGAVQAKVLTLDIRVQRDATDARLAGVGLTPRHGTPWWAQQTDAEIYAPRDSARPDGSPPLPPPDAPRFPLAREAGPDPLAWLPLGVEPLFGAATGSLPQKATPLQRDGLSRFDAGLFLDPELASAGVETLLTQGDAIRLMREQPRPLFGLHAAAAIGVGGLFNEASLLAVPDAVHLGWDERHPQDPLAVAPPPLQAPAHWRGHRSACSITNVIGAAEPLDGPDFAAFLDCTTRALAAPSLNGPATSVPPGACRLTWTDSEPGGIYVALESTQADFSDAHEIYRGPATEFDAVMRREGTYLYRVFVTVGGDRSDFSNAVVVRVQTTDWIQRDPEALPPESETTWLGVHRAALRLAAATGELFVVLTMPRHFRTAEARHYAMRLRSVKGPTQIGDGDAFGFDEARALSYGALFHPWLQAGLRAPPTDRSTSVSLSPAQRVPRVVPADGVALGVLAARASRRGAWIAPANEPLRDVVALSPMVESGDWQALQDAQINLLRADPRGLITLSADTLALDADLRPINVRRLLILLRRLALRRGNTYVFEPNVPTLRRAVQRSFQELMTDLFRRGAFAGATPDKSFRVVTDDTLNNTRHADAGRFFVELRVAPAVPMRFIAVRLTQSGERLTVVEEL